MKKFLSFIILLAIIFSFAGCGSNTSNDTSKATTYYDAASFENALNNGTKVNGSTVHFYVSEYAPNSAIGINCHAGEHLNFIFENELDVKGGDTIVVRVTKEPSEIFLLGSWKIPCEFLGFSEHQEGIESNPENETSSGSTPEATEAPEATEGPETTKAPETTKVPETTAPVIEEPTITENSTFEIHFIDVGQADSALVLCDGKAMLIDGGNAEDSSLIYTYLKNKKVSHLNYIIATHAHEDHIGGLSGALNYATVDKVYCPVKTYDSNVFNNFVKYVGNRNAKIEIPKVGTSFYLGSAKVDILGCNSTSDTNNTSIVLKITYGETTFLFTGDAEREAEQVILNAGYNLKSTVLKVGHHGSESSTTYPFLREIMPEYAVISVGKNNSYGHPTESALSRLRDADVKVYRTDLQGDIICTSDGKTVNFTVKKNQNADTLQPQAPETTPVTTPATTPVTQPETTQTPETTPATQPETEHVEQNQPVGTDYVGNKNTGVFHYAGCSSVKRMSESNKYYYTGTRDEMIAMGYRPCQNCTP